MIELTNWKMRKDLIARAPELTVAYRTRLLARLAEQGLEEWAEDERIIREVALFAERVILLRS